MFYKGRLYCAATVAAVAIMLGASHQPAVAVPEGGIPATALIQPADLAKALQASDSGKPLVIQVGSHVLYSQAHIAGSEYIGPAASDAALEQLRKRVKPLARGKFLVIYCGCCPWSHCPNLKPAYDALASMGFTNFRVLYIADNLSTDWIQKGYPTAKGD
jgi:hypothetical protein